MSYQRPAVGDRVLYTLSAGDAALINQPGAYGHHNPASEGDVCPAVVVRTFDPTSTTANLQVLLDGDTTYWATSRTEGVGLGHWSWPGRTPLLMSGGVG